MQLPSKKCRIVVDAMGGDFAPLNDVLGSVQAYLAEPDLELILVGKKDEILRTLNKNNYSFDEKSIIHADEVIGMGETPTEAIRKKRNSSLVVAANLVAKGEADALVSAGNTGAVVAAATFIIGKIKGVERPTIGTFIPNETGITTLFDVGAFVDSKPSHLLGYGIMSSIYVSEMYGIEKPTVGLLTVGEEEGKGGKVQKEAFDLFKKSKLNFVGNIEGRDILKGKVNIVICDGFIGNILLKFGESVPRLLRHLLTQYASSGLINKIKIGLLKSSMKAALKPLDYQEYGGVPLLGVKGITIIGHGSSTPRAIKNMVLKAKEMYQKNLVQKIEQSIQNYSINVTSVSGDSAMLA